MPLATPKPEDAAPRQAAQHAAPTSPPRHRPVGDRAPTPPPGRRTRLPTPRPPLPLAASCPAQTAVPRSSTDRPGDAAAAPNCAGVGLRALVGLAGAAIGSSHGPPSPSPSPPPPRADPTGRPPTPPFLADPLLVRGADPRGVAHTAFALPAPAQPVASPETASALLGAASPKASGLAPACACAARLAAVERRVAALERAGTPAAAPGTVCVEDADGHRVGLHLDEAADLLPFAADLVAVDALRRGLFAQPLRLNLSTQELAWLRAWLRHGSVASLPERAAAHLTALPGVQRWPRLLAALHRRVDLDLEEAYAGWLEGLPNDAAGEQTRAYAARLHHALRLEVVGQKRAGPRQLRVELTMPAIGALGGPLYGKPAALEPVLDPARAVRHRQTLQALTRAFELQRRWLRRLGIEAVDEELSGEEIAPGLTAAMLVATLRAESA